MTAGRYLHTCAARRDADTTRRDAAGRDEETIRRDAEVAPYERPVKGVNYGISRNRTEGYFSSA